MYARGPTARRGSLGAGSTEREAGVTGRPVVRRAPSGANRASLRNNAASGGHVRRRSARSIVHGSGSDARLGQRTLDRPGAGTRRATPGRRSATSPAMTVLEGDSKAVIAERPRRQRHRRVGSHGGLMLGDRLDGRAATTSSYGGPGHDTGGARFNIPAAVHRAGLGRLPRRGRERQRGTAAWATTCSTATAATTSSAAATSFFVGEQGDDVIHGGEGRRQRAGRRRRRHPPRRCRRRQARQGELGRRSGSGRGRPGPPPRRRGGADRASRAVPTTTSSWAEPATTSSPTSPATTRSTAVAGTTRSPTRRARTRISAEGGNDTVTQDSSVVGLERRRPSVPGDDVTAGGGAERPTSPVTPATT